jgi:predicted nucleotidyltransferase
MNPQIKAALAVHEFFSERLKLNYAVIGGIALQFWGEPRFTHDLDVTVQDKLDLPELVRLTTEAFDSRVPDPHKFARDTRMLLLRVGDVDVNVAVALQGYEDSLFARARSIEVEPGKRLNICSAEDLIIHKALASRPQDLADVQSIIQRQGKKLDVRYIRRWLGEFSRGLDDPVFLERFRQIWAKR